MNATASHPDANPITLRRPPMLVVRSSQNTPATQQRVHILGGVVAATPPQSPSSAWQAAVRRSLGL